LLDTNIVSEILKSQTTLGKKFVVYSLAQKAIPCISIWTILELRKASELYKKFLEFFSVMPFFLIKDPTQIFNNEIDCYPDSSKVDPLQWAFTYINDDPRGKLNNFMDELFNFPAVREAENLWGGKWREDALKSILSLKPNFKPKGNYYTARDAIRFLQEGVPQYVITQRPEWFKMLLENDKAIDINAFPSVKSSFYSVFYRFYAENRTPELQDVFDILITNVTPYMDIVITEKFQAEIFKKVKRRDKSFFHLDIETVKMLR